MSEYVSMSEFARRKNVSFAAVQKAIFSGRISRRESDKKIDWETEAGAWEENRDENKVRARDSFTPNMQKAKLADAAYRAKLRQLQYERECGKLIDRDLVSASVVRYAREIRDQILNIPDRVAARETSRLLKLVEEACAQIVSESDAKQIARAIDPSKIDRIVRQNWDMEARYVLENISHGPKIESP